MTTITKEMIDAALDATDFAKSPVSRRWMKNALAAAFRHAETCEPAVKTLEWPNECPKGRRVAGKGLLEYCIAHYGGDVGDPVYRWAAPSSSWSEPLYTFEAAKAAAQADFESRIRSTLTGGGNG